MRVALYGGSFNPPHLGHQLVVLCTLATARVDEVWLVPTFHHPFDKELVDFEERAAMCALAVELFGGQVSVCRIEAELGGESFTLRTVKALQARHPEHQFSLVIGADLVKERERWHGWPELEALVPFFIVGRAGAAAGYDGVELPPISSTEVRSRLARGAAVDRLVPSRVVDYILARGLYR